MISVIIPTLNEATVLEKTLSCLKESLGSIPHEIIISDGKSTDATLSIAEKYGALAVIHDKPTRQTIAEARNMGAWAAKGDILLFLDADVSVPQKVRGDMTKVVAGENANGDQGFFNHALGLFEKDPTLVAIAADLRVGKETATLMDRLVYFFVNATFRICNNVFGYGAASGEFQMIRADVFKEAKGYRQEFVAGEDTDLFSRLATFGKTYFAHELTVFHTGRRAHAIGWPKLLFQWFQNWSSVTFKKKSKSAEWTPIR